MRILWFAISVLLMGSPLPVMGAEAHIGGLAFTYYKYTLAPEASAGYNAFGLGLIQLTGRAAFTDPGDRIQVKARITYDVVNIQDSASALYGAYAPFVKFAYLELGEFLPGLRLRMGYNPPPWVTYETGTWGFRSVMITFPEMEGAKESIAELGLSALYSLPKGYGDLDVMLTNGEGLNAPERNEFKDIMARATVLPLPRTGAGLTLYYRLGKPGPDSLRNRLMLGPVYRGRFFTAMFNYMITQDGPQDAPVKGAGFSACAVADLGKALGAGSFGILARYDAFDPNQDLENDAHNRAVAGLFWSPAKGVKIAGDYQSTVFQDPGSPSAGAVYLHTQLSF